jgi:hypothetical protein
MATVTKKYFLSNDEDKRDEQLIKYNAKAQKLYNSGVKKVKLNLSMKDNILFLSYEGS